MQNVQCMNYDSDESSYEDIFYDESKSNQQNPSQKNQFQSENKQLKASPMFQISLVQIQQALKYNSEQDNISPAKLGENIQLNTGINQASTLDQSLEYQSEASEYSEYKKKNPSDSDDEDESYQQNQYNQKKEKKIKNSEFKLLDKKIKNGQKEKKTKRQQQQHSEQQSQNKIPKKRNGIKDITGLKEIVARWNVLTKQQRMTCQEAAEYLGIKKQTLDDYQQILRIGQMLGFDFENNEKNKIQLLRKFIKENKKSKKTKKTESREPMVIENNQQDFDIAIYIDTENSLNLNKQCSFN